MSKFECENELRETRKIKQDIDPIFVKRWSPRAYSGKKVNEELFRKIIEAGRLAPSCSNSQPWRVVYGHRETEDWETLFDLLVEGNQTWVKECGILMLMLSSKNDDNGIAWRKNSFDTGAFWGYLTLEAARLGIPLHGLGGFDHKKAKEM